MFQKIKQPWIQTEVPRDHVCGREALLLGPKVQDAGKWSKCWL